MWKFCKNLVALLILLIIMSVPSFALPGDDHIQDYISVTDVAKNPTMSAYFSFFNDLVDKNSFQLLKTLNGLQGGLL